MDMVSITAALANAGTMSAAFIQSQAILSLITKLLKQR